MIILGIDYGKKKIGVAYGDTETGLVEPLETVSRQLSVISYLQKLIKEREIKLIVVGTTGGKIDKEINDFGRKIGRETDLPVEFYDETLTTQDASKILGQIGRTKSYKQSMEDAIAAAVMLQSYLEREEHYV